MDQFFATVGFVVKVFAIGAVLCAVFEFVMWRLFRAKFKPGPGGSEPSTSGDRTTEGPPRST